MSNTAFKSVFQAEFENLVKLKRSLGFRYVTEEKAFTVPFSYVDLNGHMNNTRYFDLMEDCIPAAAEGKRLKSISTEYTSEVCLGDVLSLRWGAQEEECYLEGALEKPCFRMRMKYEG